MSLTLATNVWVEYFRELVGNGTILSTDDYFMENGVYTHDINKLTDAHEWNRQRGMNIDQKEYHRS